MADYILEMKNIVKEFSGVRALSNVNLSIERGEIHALCGENGAGKSTLKESSVNLKIYEIAKKKGS